MSKENNSAVENNINEAVAKDTPAPAAFTQSVPILSSITKTVKSDDDTPNKETQYGSFADNLYQKINSVIGGSNPNQFLCLTIPGQALSADDFSYDYKNNAPKGPVIEANESRLANKLFDPLQNDRRRQWAYAPLSVPYCT